MQITQAQINRIDYLFNTPTSELSSEEMFKTFNQEFNVEIPAKAWQLFLEKQLGLFLRSRPLKKRKEEEVKVVKEKKQTEFLFEVEGMEPVIVDLKEKEVKVLDSQLVNEEPQEQEESVDQGVSEQSENEQEVDYKEKTISNPFASAFGLEN